ncbi:MAG TPA: hypothetical protein VF103_12890 [Polyangiaceae bacterium]
MDLILFGPYFVALLILRLVLMALWAPPEARLRASDTLAILAPIAVYVALSRAVQDRQGFTWFVAEFATAVPVAIGLSSGPSLRVERPWVFSTLVAVAGSVTAWIAWMKVPYTGLTRLF